MTDELTASALDEILAGHSGPHADPDSIVPPLVAALRSERTQTKKLRDSVAETVADVLSDWHYAHDDPERERHIAHGSFTLAHALTHCICFGAGMRVAETFAAELERERTQNREARAIHTPVTEEAEVWIDGPGEDTHREQFPDCTDCEGHTIEMQVCSECGYDHDGDTALYRSWPCPTFVALDVPRAALSTQEESK